MTRGGEVGGVGAQEEGHVEGFGGEGAAAEGSAFSVC